MSTTNLKLDTILSHLYIACSCYIILSALCFCFCVQEFYLLLCTIHVRYVVKCSPHFSTFHFENHIREFVEIHHQIVRINHIIEDTLFEWDIHQIQKVYSLVKVYIFSLYHILYTFTGNITTFNSNFRLFLRIPYKYAYCIGKLKGTTPY